VPEELSVQYKLPVVVVVKVVSTLSGQAVLPAAASLVPQNTLVRFALKAKAPPTTAMIAIEVNMNFTLFIN